MSMLPRWPSRDKRTASQGGGGGDGKRINGIVTVSHGSIQAVNGDAEPPANHHGILPLDPCCAFTTFSLAIEWWGLEKQPLLVVEDPQFPGGRQTALKLPLALANTTKSSTRVNLLS